MLNITRKMAPLEIAAEPARFLCEATRALRKWPANFNEADIGIFKHELSVSIPATRLLELNHVNISSDGIIFSAGRILAESFNYRHEFIRWATPRNLLRFFVRNYAFKTRQRVDGQALWITDNWGGAYFHWMADALPRLYTVRDQLTGSTLLLPASLTASPHILPSLAPFAIKDIKFIAYNEIFHCRKLLVPSHTAPSGNYNERIIRNLSELYRSHYGQLQNAGSFDKVYISRGKARGRKIINEEEVVPLLQEHGFQVVFFEDYAFEEQVKIMLNARHLVSNHGAGLTNMLFLRPGSSVLELRKRGDSHNNCYFALASALDLKYYYQLCKAENSEDAFLADVFVDLKQLRRNVNAMLATEDSAGAARHQPLSTLT
jgi:capsular polysaccharide biosynthesis protein